MAQFPWRCMLPTAEGWSDGRLNTQDNQSRQMGLLHAGCRSTQKPININAMLESPFLFTACPAHDGKTAQKRAKADSVINRAELDRRATFILQSGVPLSVHFQTSTPQCEGPRATINVAYNIDQSFRGPLPFTVAYYRPCRPLLAIPCLEHQGLIRFQSRPSWLSQGLSPPSLPQEPSGCRI